MRRALLLIPLLLSTAAVVWSGLNLPPPLWIVKYGPAPGCEPEGEVTVEDEEFVLIGPGCFRMGSTEKGTPGTLVGRFCGPVAIEWGQPPEPSDEMPVHWVEFPEGFALAKMELTNAQCERFDPKHERSEYSHGDENPVVNVSWEDAIAYCAWLTKQSGRPIRLPSESEWEAACRAGSETEFCFGNGEGGLADYAWFGKSWEAGASEVGTKKPNAWGFHDLHGNVWEWCEDRFHDSYRLTETWPGWDGGPRSRRSCRAPTDGTPWLLDSGLPFRAFRGGSWCGPAGYCRSAYVHWFAPSDRLDNFGFRPALGR